MGFSESVTALLDTYSNCLELLKAFSRRGRSGHSTSNEAVLRRSIRSDRAKVRRAYSSRLSETGSRFEKGDGESAAFAPYIYYDSNRHIQDRHGRRCAGLSSD